MATRRARLPRLDARRHIERAVQTRIMVAHERALEVHLARALKAFGHRAAQAYRDAGEAGAVGAVQSFGAQVRQVMRPSLANTARTFGARLIQSPKSAHAFETKAAFDNLDAAIREHVNAYTARQVVNISESTRSQIEHIIRQGLNSGLGVEEIADLIVEATASEIGKARARRIARTETHNAAMYGQQQAAESSPFKFEKIWLATEDKRTREDHAKANGQRRPLDEPFLIGGVEMMYPGDTSAPPGLVINCRCVMLMEPIALGRDEQPEETEFYELEETPLEEAETPTIDTAQLVQDLGLLAALMRETEAEQRLPASVDVYFDGDHAGLPQGLRKLEAMIGSEFRVPTTVLLNPDSLGFSWSTMPPAPFTRPTIVRMTVPAGTPAEPGALALGEIRVGDGLEALSARIDSVEQIVWGDVLGDAGIEPAETDTDAARSRHDARAKVKICIVDATLIVPDV